MVNEILNGKRPVTTDFALMMEAARQKKSLLARLIDIKKACAAVF